MVILIVATTTPAADTIMADAGFAVTSGSLLLIGMGLLHLGISASVLRVIMGLLTTLSGFEILYSAVEGSVLVAALLAVVNLGLALVGAYLLIASSAEEAEVRMSAPTLWIVVPILFGALLLLINNQRALSILGGLLAVALAMIAEFVPIELAMRIGPYSLKIDSSLTILGRVLLIEPAARSFTGCDLWCRGVMVLWCRGVQDG